MLNVAATAATAQRVMTPTARKNDRRGRSSRAVEAMTGEGSSGGAGRSRSGGLGALVATGSLAPESSAGGAGVASSAPGEIGEIGEIGGNAGASIANERAAAVSAGSGPLDGTSASLARDAAAAMAFSSSNGRARRVIEASLGGVGSTPSKPVSRFPAFSDARMSSGSSAITVRALCTSPAGGGAVLKLMSPSNDASSLSFF